MSHEDDINLLINFSQYPQNRYWTIILTSRKSPFLEIGVTTVSFQAFEKTPALKLQLKILQNTEEQLTQRFPLKQWEDAASTNSSSMLQLQNSFPFTSILLSS